MKSQLTLLFTGGGSAGHVIPNLVLMEKLQKLAHRIIYVGSKAGIEKQLILESEVVIPYLSVTCGKLRRYFSWKNLLVPWQVIKGIVEAFFICRKYKPQLVFSKGGFVAFPLVIGAWLNRIPIIVHESDMTPGLANRLSFPFAAYICLAFPNNKPDHTSPSKNTLITGIPIRESLKQGCTEAGLAYCAFNKKKPVLLITAGSLGSESINQRIRRVLDILLSEFQIVHLCGHGKCDTRFNNIPGYQQFEYLSTELGDIIACADLVISRAGATVISELLTLKKVHILIPLPKKVSRGDQLINAAYCEKEGFSYVLQEDGIDDLAFLKALKDCYNNRASFQKKLNTVSYPDSTQIICNLILSLCKSPTADISN